MGILIKYGFLLFVFLFNLNNVRAQKQFNNWYFGIQVGLNFNTNPPQVLTNGRGNSIEGCAAISDRNGNLLFYSNGVRVINKLHETMKSGDAILGDLSSTSNVLIVPQLTNDSLFYLFTIGAANQGLKGFKYSVINMKKEGGLGEVVQKNNFIDLDCYEKLAAVRHCNKKDVWITIKKWDTDEYHSYLLTASGLNLVPVISHTGLVINGIPNNAIGALKFSADGTKLAAVHSFQNDVVELMNFDNTTGVISNPVVFKPNSFLATLTGIYGAEFSPDGKLLYISSNNVATEPATLYQFDISSMNAATILATKQIIAQPYPWFGGALQRGPDNKIYYAMWKDTSISVIENPNVYGPGCNFNYNKILLSKTITDPSQFGLPSFISSDLDIQNVPYDFIRLGGDCRNFNVNFMINRTSGIDSVKWDFGDGQQSGLYNPSHQYLAQGNYDVSLIIYSVDCDGNKTETINHEVFLSTAVSDFLPADTIMCTYKNFILKTSTVAQKYLWNTNAVTQSITVSAPGLYWLELESDGCISRDSVVLNVKPSLSVNLGKDTSVCVSKPVILNADVTGVQYLWNTGDISQSIQITKPGVYWVDVSSNDKCAASDTVMVQWGDCDLYLPNAFSPNGDGKNENFGLINGINTNSFSLKIYNRYGEIIFNSSDQYKKWDGNFKNKPSPIGLYPWVLTYKNKLGYLQTEKGTVLLIR